MVKSWMVIGGVTILVGLLSSILRPRDIKWFKRQQRPRWLTFEAAIPVIWTVIFVCGAWSAYIVWERDPGSSVTWAYMGAYLLLELITCAYSPVMLWTRSLKVGAAIGAMGMVLGYGLAIAVLFVSGWAALLLVPYLIWSPIGTFTTWQMIELNPESA